MVKHKISDGSIVNISSVTAFTTHEQWGTYAMSKAALTSFTKTAALEYSKNGIRCNAVAPGVIKTPMAKNISAQLQALLCTITALGKLGTAEGNFNKKMNLKCLYCILQLKATSHILSLLLCLHQCIILRLFVAVCNKWLPNRNDLVSPQNNKNYILNSILSKKEQAPMTSVDFKRSAGR